MQYRVILTVLVAGSRSSKVHIRKDHIDGAELHIRSVFRWDTERELVPKLLYFYF